MGSSTKLRSNNIFSTNLDTFATTSISNEHVGESTISAYIHSHPYSSAEYLENLDIPDVADSKLFVPPSNIREHFSLHCNVHNS